MSVGSVGEAVRSAQLASWSRDREGRRFATALGQIKAVLRDHPERLRDVIVAAVEATGAES